MLMANSAAILTDAWPTDKRGFALGTNQIAGLSGQFVGLVAGGLLAAIDWRLEQYGVPHAVAHQIGSLPLVSSLFATVLGVNPVQHLLAQAHALSSLPAASQRVLTGREFFAALISAPFHHGLVVVFVAAASLATVAAFASLLRGGRPAPPEPGPRQAAEAPAEDYAVRAEATLSIHADPGVGQPPGLRA
jgi:MFS family permease